MERESDINIKWQLLTGKLSAQFGKAPDVQGVLFLIGINELGFSKPSFTKEEKQDLIHIANCKVLSNSEYYELIGKDDEGWPHWKQTKNIPVLSLKEQELFIKWHILEYFDNL